MEPTPIGLRGEALPGGVLPGGVLRDGVLCGPSLHSGLCAGGLRGLEAELWKLSLGLWKLSLGLWRLSLGLDVIIDTRPR